MPTNFTIKYKTRSIKYTPDREKKLVQPKQNHINKFKEETLLSQKFKAEQIPGTSKFIVKSKKTNLLGKIYSKIKSRVYFNETFTVYEEAGNNVYFKNTYILKTKKEISKNEVLIYLGSSNEIISEEFGMYLVKYLKTNLQSWVNSLNQKSWVIFADPNAYNYTEAPRDRERDIKNAMYGICSRRPEQTIDKLIGWDKQMTCSDDIKVAVLDSGIDNSHYDLKEALNNPFKYDAVDFDDNPLPDNNNPHGTLVAGIIGARNYNEKGINGIAKGCKLADYRIAFNAKNRDGFYAKFSYSLWGLIIGLLKAADDSVNVICCSWGGLKDHEALRHTIHYISNKKNKKNEIKGIPIVFAAGNKKGPIGYPASDPNVIAVAGVDRKLNPTNDYTSNNTFYAGTKFGNNILVAACSTDITTTDMMAEYGINAGLDVDFNYYEKFGGTSAAAAQVAGCIALMLDQNSDLSVEEVKELIKTNATPFSPPPIEKYGSGVLHIKNTLLKL